MVWYAFVNTELNALMLSRPLYLLPWILLLLSVPCFHSWGPETLWGLPAWAVYSLSISVLYALVVAFLLEFGWKSAHEKGSG